MPEQARGLELAPELGREPGLGPVQELVPERARELVPVQALVPERAREAVGEKAVHRAPLR